VLTCYQGAVDFQISNGDQFHNFNLRKWFSL